MGSSPHLRFCIFKTAALGPILHVSMGASTILRYYSCKTACLASELLVSICPSPHRWILHAKQRPLDPNNMSLWVPDLTWCMQNRVIITRITNRYVFQPSSAVLYIQNSGFKTNIACLYGSQTYPVILCL